MRFITYFWQEVFFTELAKTLFDQLISNTCSVRQNVDVGNTVHHWIDLKGNFFVIELGNSSHISITESNLCSYCTMKRKLVEQFNRFSIPHESAADVWCRWLNFGQSAWETTWWHFRLLDCSSEQINIFESTLLSAASVDETSCAFEWQRNPIAIEFSETGTVELIVDVITNNNNHSTIENGVISARFQNIMTIFIQFTDGVFNHLLHIFRLEPELWAIVHLLWRKNVN